MAKPFKYAWVICLCLSILVAAGAAASIYLINPLLLILTLIPTVIYEVYRTQGETTRWASWVLLVIAIGELILLFTDVSFDLAPFFGEEEKYVGGYYVPLGDVKVVAPAAMAVAAAILFIRTRGRYTKWLAAVIFAAAFVAVYALDPSYFRRLLRAAAGEAGRSF